MPDQPPDQPTFRLTLRAVPPKPGDPPPDRRMARLLKAALRSYGFRLIEFTPIIVSGSQGRLEDSPASDPSGEPDKPAQGTSTSLASRSEAETDVDPS